MRKICLFYRLHRNQDTRYDAHTNLDFYHKVDKQRRQSHKNRGKPRKSGEKKQHTITKKDK